MAFVSAPDIGIDLGTANTLIYVKNRGIVINEPTIVLVDANDRRKIVAVGDDARYMLGRTTASLAAIMPMKGGTIDDLDAAQALMKYFVRKAIGVSHLIRPKVVVSVPSSLTAVQRKAVEQAAGMAAKSRHVYLMEKSFCAAIGSGLPVYEPTGSLIVDIGAGTTDVALVSIGGLVTARSIPVGGDRMDEAIASYIKANFHMMIAQRTAEGVKMDLGSAIPLTENRRVRIRGRDTIFSSATDIDFTSAQCREALMEPCKAIMGAIRWVLERTPPELSVDIMRNGIYLTGGGSQLYGLDQYIADELKIPVVITAEPTESTAAGLGYLVENIQLMNAMSRQITNQNE